MGTRTFAEEPTSPAAKPSIAVPLNGALLAAVLSFATVGTGGVANAQAIEWQAITSPVAHVQTVTSKGREEEGFLNTTDQIAAIRRYLSLSMTDLARVLNVGRPTVYSWATRPVLLQSKHRARISTIYSVARQWRMLSPKPLGALAYEPLSDGHPLVELLIGSKLDLTAIRNVMVQLKALQDRAETRLSVAESAKRAGVRLASRSRKNWRSSGTLDRSPDTVG